MAQKITVIKVRRSHGADINRELQWLGNSLGLFNVRDKDSSCFRVFITLVKELDRINQFLQIKSQRGYILVGEQLYTTLQN